jgi:hypothetical protein
MEGEGERDTDTGKEGKRERGTEGEIEGIKLTRERMGI